MHARIHRSRQSHPEHCAEQKRAKRRHGATDGQRLNTGNGEPQQHDIARHVCGEDVAQSQVAHGVDDAGDAREPEQQRGAEGGA
jgi:hypothetical protein